MKKLCLIISLFVIIFLTGCSKKIIKDIKVDDINACIESFDITSYTFIVVYDDKEEVKNISLDMFSSEDQEKLYEIGEHQLTLKYNGFKKTINITLAERKAIEVIANPNIVSSYLKEFSYDLVKLEVKFNDGSTETHSLSREFLTQEDILSLGKAGTYDIEIMYDEVSTIVHFELLPNEKKIEELTQDVIIYCITKKVGDVYQSTFYALGNKEFSGLQFKIKKESSTTGVNIINKNENTTVILEENFLAVIFVSSKNLTSNNELFTIEFTSAKQYNNFSLDFNFENIIVYVEDGEVLDITNYLFTFTR